MFSKRAIVTLVLLATASSGCALVPYNNEFACEGKAEYGKCTNVSGAYNESVTGESAGPKMTKDGIEEEGEEKVEKEKTVSTTGEKAGDAYLGYKNSVYRKLQGMIDEPTTVPMVKQPTQIRTLILNYASSKDIKKLYMPRYIYYFVDDYEFVLNDQRPMESIGIDDLLFED